VLYLKNLHHSVTVEDLGAVFRSIQKEATFSDTQRSAEEVDMSSEESKSGSDMSSHIRLMTGKMRGQAFVEFAS